MSINNFLQIANLLEFPDKDTFYFCQIYCRRSKMKGSNNSNRVIRTYYIKSKEHLLSIEDEVIKLCNLFEARAGINLNKRSFEKNAYHMLKNITDHILNKDFENVKRSYNTVCGKYSNGDKRWLIDIDEKDVSPIMLAYINHKCEPISLMTEKGLDSKIIDLIPTKQGWHVITKPFNIQTFKNKYPKIDIHKNNPVALFYP